MKFKTIITIDVIFFLSGCLLVFGGLLFEINKEGTFIGLPYTTVQNVIISVGCSIIASAMITFVTTLYLNDDKEARRVIDNWGLRNIEIRSILNVEINKKLESMTDGMDIIAFGMKNFLAAQGRLLEQKVSQGCTIRILTMDPNSEYIKQREKEEKEPSGQIKQSIEDLIEWANKINQKNIKGSIIIKTYDSLPQSMYQRVDKYVYVGPLHFNKPSQQTIAYEYKPNSRGAEYYTAYFTSLWENKKFCKEEV
jgi:hypothetical protein